MAASISALCSVIIRVAFSWASWMILATSLSMSRVVSAEHVSDEFASEIAVADLFQLHHTVLVAHSVDRYHLAGKLRSFLDVVAGTRCDSMAHYLLCGASTCQCGYSVEHFVLAHKVLLAGIDLHGVA